MRAWLYTIFVAALLFCLIKFYISPQNVMVANWQLFFLLILALASLSFLSSACEAAISRAAVDASVLRAIEDRRAELLNEGQPLQEKIVRSGLHELSRFETQSFKRLLSKSSKLTFLNDILTTERREDYIGSLATFSVFANLALAVLLPFALADDVNSISKLVTMETTALLRMEWSSGLLPEIYTSAHTLDLTSSKAFVFAAATFPILIFGKLIPKIIGVYYIRFFSIKLYPFYQTVYRLFGWLSIGIRTPLMRVITRR